LLLSVARKVSLLSGIEEGAEPVSIALIGLDAEHDPLHYEVINHCYTVCTLINH
jgi:hypothetical protein